MDVKSNGCLLIVVLCLTSVLCDGLLSITARNNEDTDCYPEPGATRDQCELRGCSWNVSSRPGDPWCRFRPKNKFNRSDQTFVKVDCHPEPGVTEQRCIDRGCVWKLSPVPDEPWCSFSYDMNKFAGYKITKIVANTSSRFEATLSRLNTPNLFGYADVKLTFRMLVFGDNQLQIEFRPVGRSPVVVKHLRSYSKQVHKKHLQYAKLNSNQAVFSVDVHNEPFGIRVKRRSTGQIIFDTFNISGFTHEEQYLSITTRKPTYYLYGFGENVHKSLDHDFAWRKWGMFSRDEPSGGSEHNLYGVHPFHLALEEDGKAHGILLINSNAQSIQLSPYPSLTYRTIGGMLNFVIFTGPTPEQVVQDYVNLIGLPTFPPYWSLGFHLSRYGYKSTSDVEKVFSRNQQAGLPQDVQWLDIDYMERRKDFTYDKGNFSGLPILAAKLKTKNTRLVLILDPAIPSEADDDYEPLYEGLEKNVFIRDSRTKKPIKGQVWPGYCYFPDWTNPNTTEWWIDQAKSLYESVPFDGLWIDMNEPANFVHGSTTGCANNKWNNPPFVPLLDQNMLTKTLCMDSVHYEGYHYDLHSLYGYQESVATNLALASLFPDRPFLLSRSTFVGSGNYTFHWTGDNTSEWPDLEWSIIALLEFNMFGMPFVGADICGFNKDSQGQSANEELCTRWTQLGAFYPFSRNHNSDDKKDQDPAVYSQKSIESGKNVLLIRYKFLPYLYTLLWLSHVEGSTVMRPLFFEFPTDRDTYTISDQFLWGKGLMIAPILRPNTFSRKVYFPQSRWFALRNGTEVDLSRGRVVSVQIPMYEIGLFVRGGSILPWQEPAQNTVQSRKNPFGLLVALNESGAAHGFFYWDDGVSQTYLNKYSRFFFNATSDAANKKGALQISSIDLFYQDNTTMNTVQFFGMQFRPNKVQLNGQDVPSSQVAFDEANKVFTLTGLKIDIFNENQRRNLLEWSA